MIARNEGALECDFAETYHILDYRELPPKRAALFAVGLPADSRIKRELSGQKHPAEVILLSYIADALQTIAWFKTKDGHRGTNRPKSILQEIMKDDEEKYMSFDSVEAYEAARKRALEN